MPIYLEFAPLGIILKERKVESDEDESELEREGENKEKREKTVFIKNLNFKTTEQEIEEVFKCSNLKGKILSVKIVRRADN